MRDARSISVLHQREQPSATADRGVTRRRNRASEPGLTTPEILVAGAREGTISCFSRSERLDEPASDRGGGSRSVISNRKNAGAETPLSPRVLFLPSACLRGPRAAAVVVVVGARSSRIIARAVHCFVFYASPRPAGPCHRVCAWRTRPVVPRDIFGTPIYIRQACRRSCCPPEFGSEDTPRGTPPARGRALEVRARVVSDYSRESRGASRSVQAQCLARSRALAG